MINNYIIKFNQLGADLQDTWNMEFWAIYEFTRNKVE